jgi:Type I phosphodiesterase / nucleotide pyrophosphatase
MTCCSVDGFHAVDLANWVAAVPGGSIGKLAASGVRYPNCHITNSPSDSFPGLVAILSGADGLAGWLVDRQTEGMLTDR